jgi:microcystin-dependent protein
MSEWYAGEIRTFAGNYAQVGWEFCDGRSMQITNLEILYALIGVTYGGGGVTTFKLPNPNQTLPIGQGVGLTNRTIASAWAKQIASDYLECKEWLRARGLMCEAHLMALATPATRA